MAVNLSNYFQSYINLVPKDTAEKVFQSGIYSFVLGALFSAKSPHALHHALITGTVAATASLIHAAVTTPIFKSLAQKSVIPWYQHAAHVVVNLAVTQGVINGLTPYRVNLLASAFFTLVVDFFLHNLGDRRLNRNAMYLFV